LAQKIAGQFKLNKYMAKKVKLTRPELKRYRDAMERYVRYLPMLKLKQQQLQMSIRDINRQLRQAIEEVQMVKNEFQPYSHITNDIAGLNVKLLAKPVEVKTVSNNIAGVKIPVFEQIAFSDPIYSLFGTPAWVDKVLEQMKLINTKQAQLDILNKQHELLQKELTKINQRVNLFEKVKIPECKEAIHLIRIKLGDEMTAAVVRAKIAKSKLSGVS
jgi:V/A-type H+-transporting ATPase subunit D